MRRPWLVAAALAAAAVAVGIVALIDQGSSAEANPPGFPDTPVGRKPLIFDVGSLIYAPQAQRGPALAEVRALGADALRIPVLWRIAAPAKRPPHFHPADPNDPHYNFSAYDATLRTAHKDGLKVLLMATGPAPDWAAKPGSGGLANPSPHQFGQFVTALAKRYDGHFSASGKGPVLPKPNIWTIWNEPNLSTFLLPQHRDGQPYSPIIYRKLYLAGQQAIHAQDPSAPILIGETAPTGSSASVDPITFMQETLCLDASFHKLPGCPDASEKIDAVGWSTHPYPLTGQPPFEPVSNPHFVTMSSLNALESALDGAAAAGAIPADFPIYITEFGVQSFPDPNAVSLQQQAADIGIAEHFAYADPRVVTFAQYLLQDDSPNAVPGQLYGGFESGLEFYDGRTKPAKAAFRLPLAVQRLGGTISLWGIVQPYPHSTTVEIRFKNPGHQPKNLQTIDTDSAGVYSTTYGDFPGRMWQVVWHSPLNGRAYHSPWIRSYEFAAPTTG